MQELKKESLKRQEKAYNLQEKGLTYKEIGLFLGVGRGMAERLVRNYKARLRVEKARAEQKASTC